MSMKIELDADAGVEDDTVFGSFMLVAGFVDESFEVVVFAVFVAIVAKPPVGIQLEGIAGSADDADLQDVAQSNGEPEEAHHRCDGETAAAEREGGVVFYSEVFICGRQAAVQRNDICVIADRSAEEEKELFCLDGGGEQPGADAIGGEVFGVRYC